MIELGEKIKRLQQSALTDANITDPSSVDPRQLAELYCNCNITIDAGSNKLGSNTGNRSSSSIGTYVDNSSNGCNKNASSGCPVSTDNVKTGSIGDFLLLDEISGYLHPQPGSALIQYGKIQCFFG